MPVIELFNLTVFNMDWNDYQSRMIKQMSHK